ncbi:MAG TPA: SDR family NAD(P)-dependent oxidoreductase [Bryobacteraceae bacterium]|nr:SDR family NAD(P)-dependent oxidoreductase [Bryobacteraceae bacterium]
MKLEGAVVLVTGASEGIGAACAHALRARGARVSMVARSETKLRAAADPGTLVISADLMEQSARVRAVEQTAAHFGRLDVLINNAGVGLYVPAHKAPDVETRRMFELNFFAPLHMTQLAARFMKQGSIVVNVSSIAGLVPLPWLTLYSASKSALASLTAAMRSELRGSGIHCMAVFPGYVRTQFQNNILAGEIPPALGGLKQRWSITPEQCADAILRGIERGASRVVTPASGWLLIGANWLAPGLVERQLEKIYGQHLTPGYGAQ